ncbi:MAG: hypothetical protein IJR28_03475 [Ottowia sp.]|nr:hypothetical protein [Ottowia sp.]
MQQYIFSFFVTLRQKQVAYFVTYTCKTFTTPDFSMVKKPGDVFKASGRFGAHAAGKFINGALDFRAGFRFFQSAVNMAVCFMSQPQAFRLFILLGQALEHVRCIDELRRRLVTQRHDEIIHGNHNVRIGNNIQPLVYCGAQHFQRLRELLCWPKPLPAGMHTQQSVIAQKFPIVNQMAIWKNKAEAYFNKLSWLPSPFNFINCNALRHRFARQKPVIRASPDIAETFAK